jgi:ketosteroid isomerase-like protein
MVAFGGAILSPPASLGGWRMTFVSIRILSVLMGLYAEGAVVVNEAGVLKGHDEIRPLFEAFVAEFGRPGTTFEMIDRKVEGELAYIVWTAETADNV